MRRSHIIFQSSMGVLSAGLVLLLLLGCSREVPSASVEREEASRRLAIALDEARRERGDVLRLKEEVRRLQDADQVRSNTLVSLEAELKRERGLRQRLESRLRAQEEAGVEEIRGQIAGFERTPRSESGGAVFRPALPNGCVVSATEFAWVEDASNRLPVESKPRILIVTRIEGRTAVAHSYCVFRTPRGAWFAYNPSRGSRQVVSSRDPDATAWGKELVPGATKSWFEGAK